MFANMKFFLFEWHRNVLMAAKTTFTVCIFILLQFFFISAGRSVWKSYDSICESQKKKSHFIA